MIWIDGKPSVTPFPKFSELQLAMQSGKIYREINLQDMSTKTINKMRTKIKDHLDEVAEFEEWVNDQLEKKMKRGRKNYNTFNRNHLYKWKYQKSLSCDDKQ